MITSEMVTGTAESVKEQVNHWTKDSLYFSFFLFRNTYAFLYVNVATFKIVL